MLASDVIYLTQLLKRRTGITLNPLKTGQIASRLKPVARRFGFRNTDELLRDLPHARENLIRAVLEAMTTNDTWFFRDRALFDQFRDTVLPSLMMRRMRARNLRIWSAAAATGQEAYTIAIVLHEAGLLRAGWSIDLIASDISAECIARAKEGLYSSFEVQRGLGIKRLIAYFTQEGENWRIAEHIRRMVKFRTFNLLDEFSWFGEMDVIFCRNVLLYFDQETKVRVLERFSEVLAPDGYLAVGAAEVPHEVMPAFRRLAESRGLYVRSVQSHRYAII